MLPILFSGFGLLLGVGLGYFIFIGVRAIYRGASATAQQAGHSPASAGRRAILRMLVWALSFGLLYFFLYSPKLLFQSFVSQQRPPKASQLGRQWKRT